MVPVPGSQAVTITSGAVTVRYQLAYVNGFLPLKTSSATYCVATAVLGSTGNYNQCSPTTSLPLSASTFNAASGVGTLVSSPVSASAGQVLDVSVTLSDGTTPAQSIAVAVNVVSNSYTYMVQVNGPSGGIAGAVVLLGNSMTNTVTWTNPYANATANSAGLATFSVPYGAYPYAYATAKNFNPSGAQSTPFSLGAPSGTSMTITLTPIGYTVIVAVASSCNLGPSGSTATNTAVNNLAGATVTLSTGQTATTNGGGNAQFNGLQAGPVTATITANGYQSVTTPSFNPATTNLVTATLAYTGSGCSSTSTNTSTSTSTSSSGGGSNFAAGSTVGIILMIAGAVVTFDGFRRKR